MILILICSVANNCGIYILNTVKYLQKKIGCKRFIKETSFFYLGSLINCPQPNELICVLEAKSEAIAEKTKGNVPPRNEVKMVGSGEDTKK